MPLNQPRPTSSTEVGVLAASPGHPYRGRSSRYRLRQDPSRVHTSVHTRAQSEPTGAAADAPPSPLGTPLQANPIAVSAFTGQVARELDGRVLRYSNRLALLTAAAKLGINRFEANLIIAIVQHRRSLPPPPPPTGSHWPMIMAVAVAVQAAIVAAIWRLLGA